MISDIEYLSLCKECDRILLNANKNIVSINFLHLTRENLYFSKLHKLIFSDKNFFFAGVVTIYIRNIFSIFKHFLKSIYSSRESNISGDKSFKYLFISHNTNNNVDCSAKMDSYFGSIIEHLEKNQKVFLLKINHTSKTCINSNEFAYLSNYPGVYLFISILKKLIKEWFAFKVNKEGILERRISIIAKAELLSFGTMRNLYLCSQVDDVIKQIRPNFLVTTYEGHAWERLVFYNSRFIDRKIECIAYQHAPIFKFQHSIKRSFGREYNPDFNNFWHLL